MGIPLWLLGGGAAIIGLALGYWWGEGEREKLREKIAVQEKAAKERHAMGGKEHALPEEVREIEENAPKLTEQQPAVQEPTEAAPKKRAPARTKRPKQVAKGSETKPDQS